ncbi:hypothetical protein PVOR_10859 [Paenibacillus vortex V453]|uniref:Uncharacterized protein n=1 Tax=Paenibacillus vortex V453 TaxID=715225 RepID=A0A2R9SXA0_9BACL|nr:hypothetical protein PVOR_10859 [Paenibacillus vortex V453]
MQNVQQGHVQETQGETTRGNGWGRDAQDPAGIRVHGSGTGSPCIGA